MKLETAKKIVDAALTIGLDIELREDYSGRGMYGSTTAALIGDCGDIAACAAYASFEMGEENQQIENEDMVQDLQKMQSDSMGRSAVYY